MSVFAFYFQLGLDHILNRTAYDHIAFVISFAALYQISDWKQILMLVTAFTIGHSTTLVLATLKLVSVSVDWVEFLIPVTILITATSNLLVNDTSIQQRKLHLNYIFAGVFGLVHGLGFSSYLQAILGKDESIIGQLFAFNVGLEVGQIIIVGMFLTISFLSVSILGVMRRDWRLIVSSIIAGVAFTLMVDAIFW